MLQQILLLFFSSYAVITTVAAVVEAFSTPSSSPHLQKTSNLCRTSATSFSSSSSSSSSSLYTRIKYRRANPDDRLPKEVFDLSASTIDRIIILAEDSGKINDRKTAWAKIHSRACNHTRCYFSSIYLFI